MRTIIAGSRDITDYAELLRAIAAASWVPTVVLSGTARGPDRLGERWAQEHGVPIERYPADWDGPLKRGAGHARNAVMVAKAEALLALWDGRSNGTAGVIGLARRRGLVVSVWIVKVAK